MSHQEKKGVFSVFKQEGNNRQAPFYCRWTEEEDRLLFEAVELHGPHKWSLISKHIPGRTPVQCSTRWLGALNPHVHKGRWSQEEDDALTMAVKSYLKEDDQLTEDNLPWSRIAQYIPNRTGIQCQARWTEALDPTVRKGRWKKEEDEQLKVGVDRYGCCWIRVASSIPGRTQRQCRTRWNQIQSKRQKIKQKELLAKTTDGAIKKKKKRTTVKNQRPIQQWKSANPSRKEEHDYTPIQLAEPDQTPYILLNKPKSSSNAIVIPSDILSPLPSPSTSDEDDCTMYTEEDEDDYMTQQQQTTNDMFMSLFSNDLLFNDPDLPSLLLIDVPFHDTNSIILSA